MSKAPFELLQFVALLCAGYVIIVMPLAVILGRSVGWMRHDEVTHDRR